MPLPYNQILDSQLNEYQRKFLESGKPSVPYPIIRTDDKDPFYAEELNEKTIEHTLNEMENEKLRILLGDVFAMGVKVTKDRSKFKTEEAYQDWVKDKPNRDDNILNKLNEYAENITKIFRKPKVKDWKIDMHSIPLNWVKDCEPLSKKWEKCGLLQKESMADYHNEIMNMSNYYHMGVDPVRIEDDDFIRATISNRL